MRLLIASDGSDASQHALERLLGLCRDWGGDHAIHLVNVQQPIAHADACGLTAGMDGPMLDKLGRNELLRAEQHLSKHGTDYTSVVRIGPTAHEIADYAEEIGADMIVLGTKGRSNFANVLVGSVAQRLPSLTKRAVLLIPVGE